MLSAWSGTALPDLSKCAHYKYHNLNTISGHVGNQASRYQSQQFFYHIKARLTDIKPLEKNINKAREKGNGETVAGVQRFSGRLAMTSVDRHMTFINQRK